MFSSREKKNSILQNFKPFRVCNRDAKRRDSSSLPGLQAMYSSQSTVSWANPSFEALAVAEDAILLNRKNFL